MEPANRIISLLGGPTRVANAIGVHRITVHNWKAPRSGGGTDGIIPHRNIPALLALAREQDVPLTFADFAPIMDAAE